MLHPSTRASAKKNLARVNLLILARPIERDIPVNFTLTIVGMVTVKAK